MQLLLVLVVLVELLLRIILQTMEITQFFLQSLQLAVVVAEMKTRNGQVVTVDLVAVRKARVQLV